MLPPATVAATDSRDQFAAIFQLFRASHSIILQNLDHLLNVFAHALASTANGFYPDVEGSQLNAVTRNEIVELVKAIQAQQPEKVATAGLNPYLA